MDFNDKVVEIHGATRRWGMGVIIMELEVLQTMFMLEILGSVSTVKHTKDCEKNLPIILKHICTTSTFLFPKIILNGGVSLKLCLFHKKYFIITYKAFWKMTMSNKLSIQPLKQH